MIFTKRDEMIFLDKNFFKKNWNAANSLLSSEI